jgi:hypothetical protein
MAERVNASKTQRQEETPALSWAHARALGFTSFCFVLLQSACAAVMAISGFRLLIGLGSLAAASSGLRFLIALHSNAFRIPMLVLAVGGSIANLYVIWRVRSLRARPASAWRMQPPTAARKRSETIQIALAVLTLLLVAVEWFAHIHLHGSELG